MDNARRFRGMVGIAATWGVALAALAAASLALGLSTGVVPDSVFGARELVAVAVRGLLVGGAAGGLFAWLLSKRERGHSLATLSTRRAAMWGFLAAGGIPALVAVAAAGPAIPLAVLAAGSVGFGLIGSVLSTTTLRLARRADAQLVSGNDGSGRLLP